MQEHVLEKSEARNQTEAHHFDETNECSVANLMALLATAYARWTKVLANRRQKYNDTRRRCAKSIALGAACDSNLRRGGVSG